jgi:hypothetical protein
MATNVGGDKFVLDKEIITMTANIAGKTLVTSAGTYAASAGATAYGVLEKDTASGDLGTVKTLGTLEVYAAGTVTKGGVVEALQATIYADISGTSTSTTSTGVQDRASGYIVGRARTAGSAGDTVLIDFFPAVLALKPV